MDSLQSQPIRSASQQQVELHVASVARFPDLTRHAHQLQRCPGLSLFLCQRVEWWVQGSDGESGGGKEASNSSGNEVSNSSGEETTTSSAEEASSSSSSSSSKKASSGAGRKASSKKRSGGSKSGAAASSEGRGGGKFSPDQEFDDGAVMFTADTLSKVNYPAHSGLGLSRGGPCLSKYFCSTDLLYTGV